MPQLSTLALRVHHMPAMVDFYTEAFGGTFEKVDIQGLEAYFGQVAGITFKFVPIRESADFEGFPSHQPGFEVDDVDRVVELAKKFGGRQEGETLRDGDRVHAAVRDPDGNTIEIYGEAKG